jgi:hypothetical protein
MRLTPKIAGLVFLLFVTYKLATYYSAYRIAAYLSECTSVGSFCELAKQKASNGEVTSAMAAAYSCVKNKQSSFEAFFVPIPKHFSDPAPESVSYRDAEKLCDRK